jgi:hypothetical protein
MLTFKESGRSIVLANPFGNLDHNTLIDNDCTNNIIAKYLDKELKIDLHTKLQQFLVQACCLVNCKSGCKKLIG